MKKHIFLVLALLLSMSAIADGEASMAENSPEPFQAGIAPKPNEAEAQAAPEQHRFDIMEYQVVGNSLLPAAKIEEAVYPFLGQSLSIEDVDKAREALEKLYHQEGYLTVLVSVPEQKVDAGVVRLDVTQAPVERLRVTGSRYYSLGRIKAVTAELEEGKVPHFPTVQKELGTLNRTADRRVTPVLKPGKTPGTVAVDLKVEDQLPLHGSIELNDHYSADTTKTRLSANVRWDNLWQLDHSIGVSIQLSPENTDESKVISGTYSIPLASGDYLALYGVHSESNVAAVGTLNVLGNGDIVGLRFIHPLPTLENFYHSLTLGVDYKNFVQTVNISNLSSGSFNTPISYLPFMASWEANWNGESSTTNLGIILNAHLRDVVGSEKEFDDKRFKGHSDYFYLRANLAQNWKWKGGFGVGLKLTGQLSGQALISNEQFAIGGADSVRGYLESEALGDTGFTASLELRSPSFANRLSDKITQLYVLGFMDAGQIRVKDPVPGSSSLTEVELASAGLGLRAEGLGGWKGGVDIAYPLREGPRTPDGDTRLSFSLGYGF
ncbi:MAG: ShlB/FhaC/HecB family hemolysin secretion/activation protein [Methylophilaceae bacterium]